MFTFGSGIAVGVLAAVVPFAGLIYIGLRATGTARTLGMIGCAVLVVITLVRSNIYMALPALMRAIGGDVRMIISLIGGAMELLYGIGLILVIIAVGAGRAPSGPRPTVSPPPQPGPGTGQYPPPAGPQDWRGYPPQQQPPASQFPGQRPFPG